MPLDLTKYDLKLARIAPPARGTVLRVTGQTIESKGPPVGLGQICEVRLADGRRVPAEVVGFHGDNRILLPLESIEGIAPNDPVFVRACPHYLTLSDDLLGRVIDGLGRPIDGLGPLTRGERRSLNNCPPPALKRRKITEPLAFGLRVIDGILTVGKGQRVGIFAGSGVGKSTLLGEIAHVSEADVNVLCLVGERGREVRHFLEDSLGSEGLRRSVVAVATADTSPIQRVRVAFEAITIAEYFRDRGKNVMFMMDSVTRFAQAQREIGLASGEPPATKGYCPSVFSMLPRLTERLGCAEFGSITGIFTILVEGDDMNDPVADSMRSLLDGHVVLSRKLAEMGHYPAVDILQSVSRLMNSIVSPEHRAAAQALRAIYSTYQNAEDLINIGAFAAGSNPRIDKAIALIDRVRDFLIQPTGTASKFSQTLQRLCEITQPWDAPSPAPQRGGAK
ncbi:MAG: FliI/YscN family ATPase [Phycisphaerae bacterium]|jgi:flagellum-specific ATP synthase